MARPIIFSRRYALLALGSLPLAACTATPAVVDPIARAEATFRLSGRRVAVFDFTGPEAQRARDLAIRSLATIASAKPAPPSAVDGYARPIHFSPNEFDPAGILAAADALRVDVIAWGAVNQFTPYRFDRLVPATPAYVEITLNAAQARPFGFTSSAGRKQSDIPTTIWDRQPSFDDVARPVLDMLAADLA